MLPPSTSIDLILNSELSKKGLKITDPDLTTCVKRAMIAWGFREIEEFKRHEQKASAIEAIQIIPSLLKGRFKMALRKIAFNFAKKEALGRAATEQLKIYVIRSSDIGYITLSTKDFDHNKKRRIFGKYVDSLRMSEMADYIVFPTRKKP